MASRPALGASERVSDAHLQCQLRVNNMRKGRACSQLDNLCWESLSVQPLAFIYAHCLHLHAIMHIISLFLNSKCIQQQRLKEKRYACAFQFTMWWSEKEKSSIWDKHLFFSAQGKNGEKAQDAKRTGGILSFFRRKSLKKRAGKKICFKCAVWGRAVSTETTSLPAFSLSTRAARISWADSASARARRYNLIAGDPGKWETTAACTGPYSGH